jgi:hypothetical protein
LFFNGRVNSRVLRRGCWPVRPWKSLPAKGVTFDTRDPLRVYLPALGRDFYMVALMDLLGFVEVDHPQRAVQPWCPARVRHAPFGDAVLELLAAHHTATRLHGCIGPHKDASLDRWTDSADPKAEANDESSPTPRFGTLQPIFQPYFPAWRENLVIPRAERREGTHVFRVALGRVWRRIAIDARSTVDELAHAILRSVKFDDEHLYEFIYRDRAGTLARVSHPSCEEGPWTEAVRIGALPLELGQSMEFHYDFGDDREFDVRLERVDPAGKRLARPRVLERRGSAPAQYSDWGE